MDNFRRHSTQKAKPRAMDGFLPGNATRPKLRLKETDRQHRTRSLPATPNGRRRVGDFSAAREGFTPRRNNRQLADATATGRRASAVDFSVDMSTTSSPRSTKKNDTQPKTRRHLLRRFASLTTILVLLLSGFVFGKGYLKARQIFAGGGGGAAVLEDGMDPNKLKGEGDGRINIMLLANGGAGHDGADLTDTIMIASIDPINNEAGLVSIPRDLWVRGKNGSMKINALYATAKENALYEGGTEAEAEKAGFAAVQSKASEILGIPIHYHVRVDFAGFQQAIDTVGGVTIDVKEPLYDEVLANENRGNPVLARAGLQQMGGKQALLYAQSRYGSARGDFDRNQRQREVLVALKDKVFSAGTFGNPVKITQLLSNFGDHISTDFSIDEIMRLYEIGKKIDSSKITSLGLADEPHVLIATGNVAGQSVVLPRAGTFDYSAIQSLVRNTFKDGFIRKENPSIMVLNGSGVAGEGTKRAEELKSYGYNVISVGDAPSTDFSENILVDMRGGEKKYTKRYLELRFKTGATSKLPEGIMADTADFVIILGSNGTSSN